MLAPLWCVYEELDHHTLVHFALVYHTHLLYTLKVSVRFYQNFESYILPVRWVRFYDTVKLFLTHFVPVTSYGDRDLGQH